MRTSGTLRWSGAAACAVLLTGLPAVADVHNPAALIQSASQIRHGTTVSVSLSPTRANALIVVGLMFTNQDPSPVVVTDNAPGGSNIYKLATDISGPNHQYLYYAEGAKGGVTQVTVTGAYSVIDLIAAEYRAVVKHGALDRTSAFNNGYSADNNWRTGLTQTTRRAPELLVVIGGGTYFATDFIQRAGTGYNFVTTHVESGHYVSGLMMEDRVVTAVGRYEGTGYTQMVGGGKDIRYGIIATFYLEPAALSYQYDNTRAGANLNESILTRANVNANQFGKLFADAVDGYVHGQPLYLANVEIPGKGVHNIVYVVTGHDTVYAFDADGNAGQNAVPLWRVSFIDPGRGVTTVPAEDTGCSLAEPEIGISSTPVIDPASGTLYVVAMTKESAGGAVSYVHRLHALDVASGKERPGSPAVIQASYPGTGDGDNTVVFNPGSYKQQSGLLLLNGVVYAAFSSHCDVRRYHGWLIGYDARSLQQVAVYNDTPNGNGGSFWASGAAPGADRNGSIYLVSGNGTFDGASGGPDLGQSYIKLASANGLSVADYFTPFNFADLNRGEVDLGSGGVALLPDGAGSVSHPHLMVGAGEEGRIYLLDRDRLGGHRAGSDSQIVASLPGAIGAVSGNPAYFNNAVYFCAAQDSLKAFPVTNATLSAAPVSSSGAQFGFPGCVPAISANGAANGIVWLVEAGGVLHAYDASNLGNELYNSGQNPGRDSLGSYVNFSVPTVANGKVYAGTQNSLVTYGLLPPGDASLAVTNAASGQPGPVAPGSIVSIYGTGLAQSTASAPSLPLPTTLAGVTVRVNNLAAPVFYASPGQINAQVPFEAPLGTVSVAVSSGDSLVAAGSATVQPVAPGLFTLGQGQSAALNQDYSLNSAARPAPAGSVIVVYVTGLGPVENPVATGLAATAHPLSRVTSPVTATIDGRPAQLMFAGLAPGFAGLYQVNIVVPQIPPGDHPLQLIAGNAASNIATISVD